MGAAAFDTAAGYISYSNGNGQGELYIVQVNVDHANLLDAVYNKTASVYRMGYSSLSSWQVLSVDVEFHSMTIYKALGRRADALQGVHMTERLHVEATEGHGDLQVHGLAK